MDVMISVEHLAIQTTTTMMATTIVTTIREAINHRVVIHEVEAIPNLFHLRLPHPPIPIMIVKKIKDGIIVVVVVVVVVENVGANMKMKKTDVELVIVKRTAMNAHAISLVIEMMIITIVTAVIVIMIENAIIVETEMIVDVGNAVAVEATNAMNEEVDSIEELVRTAINFELGGKCIPILRVLAVKND
jgi:hypothetical protein